MALNREEVLATVSKVYELHHINNPAQEALHADVFISLWELASEETAPADRAMMIHGLYVDPADPLVKEYAELGSEIVQKYQPADPGEPG